MSTLLLLPGKRRKSLAPDKKYVKSGEFNGIWWDERQERGEAEVAPWREVTQIAEVL
jgi:hypothetical protein